MLRLVGLSGEARCGKSSLSGMLSIGLDYYEYSLSAPIKDLMCALFNWDERHREGDLKETEVEVNPSWEDFVDEWVCTPIGELLNIDMSESAYMDLLDILFPEHDWNGDLPSISPRRAYQLFGTEYGRARRSTIWLDLAKAELDAAIAEDSGLIICDIRFPNEHRWLSQNAGLMVHVRRDGAQHVIKDTGHSSETGLHPMAQDWVTPFCKDLDGLRNVSNQLIPFIQVSDTSETAVRAGFPNFDMIYGDRANG